MPQTESNLRRRLSELTVRDGWSDCPVTTELVKSILLQLYTFNELLRELAKEGQPDEIVLRAVLGVPDLVGQIRLPAQRNRTAEHHRLAERLGIHSAPWDTAPALNPHHA